MGTNLLLMAMARMEIESRTLISGPELILNERIVGDRRIVVRGRRIGTDGTISFSTKEYREDGTPILSWQEGFWSDRWNRFETTYGNRESVQNINGVLTRSKMVAKEFRDPTVLWFWKTHPKVGESVTVKFLAQNVINTFEIRFTYEGEEEMTLAGKRVRVHRVREDPLSAKGVFTHWWYDDRGMGVRRYHKTTTSEFVYDLKAWN